MTRDSEVSPSSQLKWFIRAGYGVIVAVLLIGGVAIYQGVTTARDATKTLNATMLTVDLIHSYVKQHDGQWPQSWDDLAAVPPPKVIGSGYRWPEDRDQIAERVYVDFAADPQAIAHQKPEEFDAVKPIGSYYPWKENYEVQSLLKTLRGEDSPAADSSE
ncbi:hypothetical protein [Aeoliella mucimassa]|uniref:Uncharacterized protein n=1 Tax=Aeoliella mucimassa TaxID=2527972 RepID=A0A518ARH3_9BACT|nr:hypothetical protein [Aeoliella mucimassa]QDU57315.1 hypothetical protein Pan181_35300 [Aeoliella mucimassa]